MKFTSIRQKMIAAISLFVAILLITIACGAYAYFRHATRELIFNHEFSLVSNVAKGLDDKIVSSHNALIAISKVAPSDAVGNREITQKWLENRVGVRSLFNHGLYIYDAAGMLVASSPQVAHLQDSSFSDQEFLKTSKNSCKPYISSPFLSKIDQKPVVIMTAPLLNENGSMKGLLCGEISLLSKDNLFGEVSQVRLGSSGYMYVFGHDRTMIMHPDTSRIMKKDVLPGANKLFDKSLEGFEGSGETINSQGHHFLASFKRLKSTGWILAANYPLEEVLQPMTQFSNYYFAGMLILFLIALVLAWKLGIGIAKPLINLSAQVRDLANTNSATSRRIESEHVDEIGMLADSFNSLLNVLQQREQTLKEKEEKFRNIFHFANDSIFIIYQGIFIDCNEKTLELFSCTREEIIGQHPDRFSPEVQPDGRKSVEETQEKLEAALRGQPQFFEWKHRRCDGTLFDAEVSLNSFSIEDKCYLQAIVRDITERKRTAGALYESEERNRMLVKNTSDVIFNTDSAGKFTFANPAAFRIAGYGEAEDEIIGKHFSTLIRPDIRDEAIKFLGRQFIKERKKNVYYEYPIITKDAREIWLGQNIQTIEEDGSITGFHSVGRDITERKRSEEALRETRRQLADIIEFLPDATLAIDKEKRIIIWNKAIEEMTGIPASEMIGKGDYAYTVPFYGEARPQLMDLVFEDREEIATRYPQITNEGGTLIVEAFCNALYNNKGAWVAAKASPLHDQSGSIIGAIESIRDITDIKHADESLRMTNRQLEEATARAELASVAKSEFLANMSHEIRTPMNGVIGMTGLLLDTELSDEQRKYAEIVRSSGESLLTLLNDILDFSKMEAGKLEMEMLDFDLRALLDDFAATLALRAHDKGLEFICAAAPDLPAYLCGDPGRLRQILTNLTGNAVKFTHKGEIAVRVSLVSETDDEAVLRFSVKDTGIGILAEKQALMFQKFTQADASTTRQYGGTGLGLAISKELAERMGGEIGVISEGGQGSDFWFTARFARQTDREHKVLPLAEIRGTHILIVDDNATNREVLMAQLRTWGMRAEETPDGPTALQALYLARDAGDPFQIAILDMQMPGMDGITLGRMIKIDDTLKDTRLVLLSSLGRRGDAKQTEEIGFTAYLTKPARQSDLYDCLSTVLAGTTVAKVAKSIVTRHTIRELRRSTVRILLAEDNITNQQVAIGILKKLGLRADAAANGAEAVKALESIPYDLVLMDIQMPVMDGMEATQQIRNPKSAVLDHDIPIIAMTAHTMQGDREKFLNVGMNDYVSKPISPQALADALDKWLPQDTAARKENVPAKAHVHTPATPGTAGAPVFDKSDIIARMDNDEDLAREVIVGFLDDIPRQISALRGYLEAGDTVRVERQAHTIKGASASVGGEALRVVAFEMEKAGKAGELEVITASLPELEAQFARLKVAMNEFIMQGGIYGKNTDYR